MKVAVEVNSIAGMPDNAVPVARFFIEAKCHSIHGRVGSELAGMHQSNSLRAKNASATKLAILKVSNHEVCHVYRRSRSTAGRPRLHYFKRLRTTRCQLISTRHQRRQIFRQRHLSGAVFISACESTPWVAS